MAPLPDVLVGYIEEIVDRRLAAWREATVAIAKEPEPEPAPTGWITDRVPTAKDAGCEEEVRVASRDEAYKFGMWAHWSCVYPGTPWAHVTRDPGPWDPTTLDRNGWIRSRLPTAREASKGKWPERVLIPAGEGQYPHSRAAIAYHLVTPGQPWAPWGADPGPYQP
jgi:hypothetical protein